LLYELISNNPAFIKCGVNASKKDKMVDA